MSRPLRPLLYLLLGLLASCYGQIEDREKVLEAMNAMEIKRVTDIQLEQWVRYQGDKVSRVGQKALNRVWIKAESDKAVTITFLDSLFKIPIPVLDSLAQAQNLDIYRLGFGKRPAMEEDLAKPTLELLSKYQKKEIALEPQARVLDNPQIILYTSPIILNAEAQGMWAIYFDRTQTIRQMDMDEFEEVILKQ